MKKKTYECVEIRAFAKLYATCAAAMLAVWHTLLRERGKRTLVRPSTNSRERREVFWLAHMFSSELIKKGHVLKMITLTAQFCLFATKGWKLDVTGQDNFEIKKFCSISATFGATRIKHKLIKLNSRPYIIDWVNNKKIKCTRLSFTSACIKSPSAGLN